MPASATSAVDKALDVIEAVAGSDHPLRLSEISAQLGLHRATAYRVLAGLVERGWVLRVGERYLPGAAVLRLSRSAAASSLARLARPTLEALAKETGMMANLQVLEGAYARVVEVVRPARLEMISDLRDELLPVHRFAGPLALVASLSPAARTPFLRAAEAGGCELQGPDGLLTQLERAVADGFAVQRGRSERLIASVSRAILVEPDSTPVCALTLVGPVAEFDDERMPGLERRLSTACTRLGGELLRWTRTVPPSQDSAIGGDR